MNQNGVTLFLCVPHVGIMGFWDCPEDPGLSHDLGDSARIPKNPGQSQDAGVYENRKIKLIYLALAC